MRSMHKVALPGQDTGQSQTINTNTNSSSSSSSPSLTSTVGTITGLIFFGKYDTSAGAGAVQGSPDHGTGIYHVTFAEGILTVCYSASIPHVPACSALA